MNEVLEIVSFALLAAGVGFFLASGIGLVRLPDLFCRLHAVAKADALGLGLVAAGLACRADDGQTVLSLLLIWLLVLIASAVSCQLLARFELGKGGKFDTDG